MSDIAEIGECLDRSRKEKKSAYRLGQMPEDIKKVKAVGFVVEEKNDGEHLIIHKLRAGKIQKVDYWPSTQKFKFRECTLRGYGVDNLIRNLNK